MTPDPDLAEMRRQIVRNILDNDSDTVQRAVEEYVEGYTDDTVLEWYKQITR